MNEVTIWGGEDLIRPSGVGVITGHAANNLLSGAFKASVAVKAVVLDLRIRDWSPRFNAGIKGLHIAHL